jgi:glycosyltransferase involved in cell wall biosynthesis
MSPVLFYDPLCVRPYTAHTLRETGLGGTEATVTRIAEALDALVVQHNRVEREGRYLPPGTYDGVRDVVLLRDARHFEQLRKTFPNARMHLWVHDRIGPWSSRGRKLVSVGHLLRDLGVTIICVSQYQRGRVDDTLRRIPGGERIQTRTIYNPVDDDLVPDGSKVDPSKIVFFSSPNKGLAFAIDAFRALRRRMPDLRLRVGNPGYKLWPPMQIDGVEWLGPLPHDRVLSEVRTALCTFFPNFVIPETFGLVFAESKAVGTPVLTHACGAADEVLADPRQTLPVTLAHRAYETPLRRLTPQVRSGPARVADWLGLFNAYAERIESWRSGTRPSPVPDQRFHLSTVVGEWRTHLGL